MAFQEICTEYLAELRALKDRAQSSGQFTPELSYRPALDAFFERISLHFGSHIERVFEPKNQNKKGRPDWLFYDKESLGVLGYVEGKGLDETNPISVDQYEDQVNRYLSLGNQVLLTDGIEFVFYEPGRARKSLSLADKPVTSWAAGGDIHLVEEQFRQFFQKQAARTISDEQLMEAVAARAKELSKSVLELSGLSSGAGVDEEENRAIEILRDLQNDLSKQHDPSLTSPEAFSGFVAQVLIFGLVYSHRATADSKDDPLQRHKKLREYWVSLVSKGDGHEHVRPFRALVDILGDELAPESLGPLGVWYENCALLLAHVKLSSSQKSAPDFHKLYEEFLAVFDPKTKFDFGAFYTPAPLADYMVRMAKGLAPSVGGIDSLYSGGNKLIDPCCGTGSFIERLLYHAPKDNQPTYVGFEVLPAPYALAYYRLLQLTGNETPSNVHILLTNTLSDQLEDTSKPKPLSLLEEEQQQARNLAKPPFTLVIGNPPSSDAPSSLEEGTYSRINKLVDDFRPPAGNRTARQNTQKQLQNEFIKFLRWGADKVLSSEAGILAFVVPGSFAAHPSYRYAREWLTAHFDDIWILDLDKDARTGVRTTSLFKTLQGRMMILMTKPPVPSGTGKIHYKDISGLSRAEKLAFLSREVNSAEYETIPSKPAVFRPQATFDREKYLKFWSLAPDLESGDERYIFERHVSGIKLAPSHMLVHVSAGLLSRKLRDIADMRKSVTDLINSWFAGQQRAPQPSKFKESVREAIGRALKTSPSASKYSYRPFTPVNVLLDEGVLNALVSAGGGGTRARPEIMAAYKDPGVSGIAVSPAPSDIGDSLHRFVSYCWYAPDNDLTSRGNAHIFTNKFPEYKKGHEWDSTPKSNINAALLKSLGLNEGSADEVVFYCYGILCSDTFLDAFTGALHVAAGTGWPRIPLTSDKAKFDSIRDLGRDLAELEKSSEEQPLDNFSSFEDSFTKSFRLTSFELNEDDEKIVLYEDGLQAVELRPVPREVICFKSSGYRVIQQWLKMRTHTYKRAVFDVADHRALLALLSTIEKQLAIVRELDENVKELLEAGELM